MKRLPLFCTVLALAALSASLAYWALQWFKPPQRPLAAPPAQVAAGPAPEAARGLFGGQVALATVSNYQLKGVVAAADGRGSAAILAVDGMPAEALAVGREVAPGVVVKEIHAKHVLLSEGGVIKRIELASDGEAGTGVPASPLPAQGGQPGAADNVGGVNPPPSPPLTPPRMSASPTTLGPPDRQ
ncbi:type II secretion system protein N [Rugamonas sp. DEMB1]|uniref:type II secretion system protein N n=1 Tax=Rugamonas sp. DEMB1 TaxID=3039386 RepID=UPI00244C9A2C|nr:type II secretion system protein N [Rugamonas sp. DEMB1]WGG50232.1 type II secretion system protein N [Rugamonas sp. DEMB1]